MGKVRMRKVKQLAREVLELYADSVTVEFGKNKLLVREAIVGRASKKLSNRVTGYLTSLAKRLQQEKAEEQSGQVSA